MSQKCELNHGKRKANETAVSYKQKLNSTNKKAKNQTKQLATTCFILTS